MMNTIMTRVQMIHTMAVPTGHGLISYTTFKNELMSF